MLTDRQWSRRVDAVVAGAAGAVVVGCLIAVGMVGDEPGPASAVDAEALTWCEQRFAPADDDQLAYRAGDLEQLTDLAEIADSGQDLRHSSLAATSRRMWGLVDSELNGRPVSDDDWYSVADEAAATCRLLAPGDWEWMRTGGP